LDAMLERLLHSEPTKYFHTFASVLAHSRCAFRI